ncbi:MAG: electron transport complex subunit RsxG [Gammaproteobacteria bacterium]|nr:electron transport complex subunit RsxG [Gammaproteobacteria bacterium]
MNIHKQVATTALLLMLFAVIGAALVGFIYDRTYDTIKKNEELTLLRELNHIVPASSYDNDLLASTLELAADQNLGTTETSIAYRAKKQGKNVAVVFSAIAPNGYNGSIHLLVGIYHDGNLAGVRVVKHRETPGLGDAIEAKRSDWILSFTGKSLDKLTDKQWKVKRDGGEFDQFTGATITPRAVVKAVHAALIYFKANKKILLPDDDKNKENYEQHSDINPGSDTEGQRSE